MSPIGLARAWWLHICSLNPEARLLDKALRRRYGFGLLKLLLLALLLAGCAKEPVVDYDYGAVGTYRRNVGEECRFGEGPWYPARDDGTCYAVDAPNRITCNGPCPENCSCTRFEGSCYVMPLTCWKSDPAVREPSQLGPFEDAFEIPSTWCSEGQPCWNDWNSEPEAAK